MKARARVVHREDLHRRRHGRSPRGNAIRLDARRVKDATRTARSILRHCECRLRWRRAVDGNVRHGGEGARPLSDEPAGAIARADDDGGIRGSV